jgi:hypothetical protein
MPGFRFDHAIIAVMNLNDTTEDFKRLGFNVHFGGQHAGGRTHNALIVFGDGTYLELLAPTDVNFLDNMETVDLSHFLDFVAQGDGWAGFALHTTELDSAAKRMKQMGLHPSQPSPGSRLRPDGKLISWRSVSVDNSRAPFFIEDQTDRGLRVPSDDSTMTHHSNGVTGVESIVVAVHKLERAVENFETMLEMAARRPGPAINGAETAVFNLGSASLILAAPDALDSPIQAYISERGEVPYEIRLRTSKPAEAGSLNYRKVHRARIQLLH